MFINKWMERHILFLKRVLLFFSFKLPSLAMLMGVIIIGNAADKGITMDGNTLFCF